jgi:hypothetical protein
MAKQKADEGGGKGFVASLETKTKWKMVVIAAVFLLAMVLLATMRG